MRMHWANTGLSACTDGGHSTPPSAPGTAASARRRTCRLRRPVMARSALSAGAAAAGVGAPRLSAFSPGSAASSASSTAPSQPPRPCTCSSRRPVKPASAVSAPPAPLRAVQPCAHTGTPVASQLHPSCSTCTPGDRHLCVLAARRAAQAELRPRRGRGAPGARQQLQRAEVPQGGHVAQVGRVEARVLNLQRGQRRECAAQAANVRKGVQQHAPHVHLRAAGRVRRQGWAPVARSACFSCPVRAISSKCTCRHDPGLAGLGAGAEGGARGAGCPPTQREAARARLHALRTSSRLTACSAAAGEGRSGRQEGLSGLVPGCCAACPWFKGTRWRAAKRSALAGVTRDRPRQSAGAECPGSLAGRGRPPSPPRASAR